MNIITVLIFIHGLVAVALPGTPVPNVAKTVAEAIAPKLGNDHTLAAELSEEILKTGSSLLQHDPKSLIGSTTASFIHGVDANDKPVKVVGFSQGLRGKLRAERLLAANPGASEEAVKAVRVPESDPFRTANQHITELRALNPEADIGPLPGSELRKTHLDACRQGNAAHLGACAEHEAFELFKAAGGSTVTHSGAVQFTGTEITTLPRCANCRQFHALGNAVTDDLPNIKLIDLDPTEVRTAEILKQQQKAKREHARTRGVGRFRSHGSASAAS